MPYVVLVRELSVFHGRCAVDPPKTCGFRVSLPICIVGSGAFLAAVLTVHLVRRKVSRSVDRKNAMPVSIQFLSALQKLEQLRETTPQFAAARRAVRACPTARDRHRTASLDRTASSECAVSSNFRRTSCRTPPSPGNLSGPRPGSSMRQARTSFNRPLSVLRMPGILAVHPALRLPEGLSPPEGK